jgi:succinyldiaminopimelate transaminase
VQKALVQAADAPGYPLTAGSPGLRAALRAWVAGRLDCAAEVGVLPTIGSKELVAWLPRLLGLGAGDTVLYPSLAYPTYDVGIRLAGATGVRSDATLGAGPGPVAMMWVNSPSNPTGRVLGVPHLRKVVAWARERGTIVASDECYLELGWSGEPPVSILADEVCDGHVSGLLAVHSLSKRSNLAGYRAGFVAGDPALIDELLAVRKHAGMIVPEPVQAAMVAALGDSDHVSAQRGLYAARREVLHGALRAAGFRIDHSEAGLYLWATRDEDCWTTVGSLADQGILVAPGSFYGPSGAQHVRVALTGTDERIRTAAARLTR